MNGVCLATWATLPGMSYQHVFAAPTLTLGPGDSMEIVSRQLQDGSHMHELWLYTSTLPPAGAVDLGAPWLRS